MTIEDKVVQYLINASDLAVSADQINPDTSLRNDLGLNSLQAVDLVMDLEDTYRITIEDEELGCLETVGDILSLIESKRS